MKKSLGNLINLKVTQKRAQADHPSMTLKVNMSHPQAQDFHSTFYLSLLASTVSACVELMVIYGKISTEKLEIKIIIRQIKAAQGEQRL